MNRGKIRILAIDPGTREMGIACLEGDELIYHGVECIKHRTTPHEALMEVRRILLRLIRDYKPGLLVYEKTFFANNRNSALLNVISDEIKSIGKKEKLEVLGFAANTVKKKISGDGRASKEEIAKIIITKYPELKAYLKNERKWVSDFHFNMFDSVALGMMVQ